MNRYFPYIYWKLKYKPISGRTICAHFEAYNQSTFSMLYFVLDDHLNFERALQEKLLVFEKGGVLGQRTHLYTNSNTGQTIHDGTTVKTTLLYAKPKRYRSVVEFRGKFEVDE
ncbi:hypothetical protein PAAG_12035 [Paracoccidioides lutzii Pb01]|uniref:Uncharacterized protein n=1 Tax=Paracoccidioides lutzii (strain ATCC MYA-826 / Pb01) TaxID=502779 RepID=A0A0A2VK50_PARBA|nr:hypothetical protein PAAG_12035 [Paracoccidioides lutzii Pb01]KGQ01264.1 hypothetical protein PAAG_12035 [Paracoccidioides lutzii Pb01]